MSLIAVHGENFSGRTMLLRNEAIGTGDTSSGVYVGPEVYNYISALSANVQGELDLHRVSTQRSSADLTPTLVDALQLTPLLHRNPFTLSGGQQAAVALAAASVMGTRVVSADSCLEQLDGAHRHAILYWAQLQSSLWFVADNRIDEFADRVTWSEHRTLSRQHAEDGGGPLYQLTVPEHCPIPGQQSTTLELDNIHFEYHPDHPVLRGVSMALSPGLYALDGSNGAGKSTLAKLLCGVLRPRKGQVRVHGRDARTWLSPGRLVGYHFQNQTFNCFPRLWPLS